MSLKIKENSLVTLFDGSVVRVTKVLENGEFMCGMTIYNESHLKKEDKKVDKKVADIKS